MERIREISSLSHSLEYCYSPILLSISLHYETCKTKASSSSVTLNNHKCNSEFHHHLLQRESGMATEVASHQMCDTWVAIWTWAKNKKPPSLVRHLLGENLFNPNQPLLLHNSSSCNGTSHNDVQCTKFTVIHMGKNKPPQRQTAFTSISLHFRHIHLFLLLILHISHQPSTIHCYLPL